MSEAAQRCGFYGSAHGGASRRIKHYSKFYDEAGSVLEGWENTPLNKLTPRYRHAVAWPPPASFAGHHLKDHEKRLLSILSVRSRAVMLLYVIAKVPAKTLWATYGGGFLSQSDVYFRAAVIKKALARMWEPEGWTDWKLAADLAAEGASDDEIAELFKVRPEYVRAKLRHQSK